MLMQKLSGNHATRCMRNSLVMDELSSEGLNAWHFAPFQTTDLHIEWNMTFNTVMMHALEEQGGAESQCVNVRPVARRGRVRATGRAMVFVN